MRIIVVEQDAALGQFLARSLGAGEHETQWVCDGESALAQVESADFDLMVLDLLLPTLSGLDVLERMQLNHPRCSVITLTAEESAEARVRCLNIGADDCIAKPFSLQELIARCHAQLRRRSRLNSDTLEHNGLVLNRRDRTVHRDGIAIDLTTKEFALLEHLLERRGRCTSRTELLLKVFQLPEHSTTNVVEVYINYLRRKLAPDALSGAPAVIETVRGSGYRISTSSSLNTKALPQRPFPLLQAASL